MDVHPTRLHLFISPLFCSIASAEGLLDSGGSCVCGRGRGGGRRVLSAGFVHVFDSRRSLGSALRGTCAGIPRASSGIHPSLRSRSLILSAHISAGSLSVDRAARMPLFPFLFWGWVFRSRSIPGGGSGQRRARPAGRCDDDAGRQAGDRAAVQGDPNGAVVKLPSQRVSDLQRGAKPHPVCSALHPVEPGCADTRGLLLVC